MKRQSAISLGIAAAGFLGVTSVHADFVINDDLIVDGSECVGFDCVNGESFGFDTLRLKENNLRIKFDDTSSTASFPKRDWTILVNDSANGGLERFSIEDVTAGRIPVTIEGNAPSNSLYVDDGGRLGLGTSTPVVEVHIKDGDTPTLRLEQDGSSGFTPQTWDVAGNETNFFVRDATNGSKLPFRIRPGAPSNSVFVDTNGNVGVGTSSPGEKFHVSGTAAASTVKFKVSNLANAGNEWAFSVTDASQFEQLRLSKQGSGGVEVTINPAGDSGGAATLVVDGSVQATNVTFASSRQWKTDIVAFDGQQVLDRIATLPIATWRLKSEDPSARHIGPMAEDFKEAFDLSGSGKTISMVDANGIALAAIQALALENQGLKERLAKLESRLQE